MSTYKYNLQQSKLTGACTMKYKYNDFTMFVTEPDERSLKSLHTNFSALLCTFSSYLMFILAHSTVGLKLRFELLP